MEYWETCDEKGIPTGRVVQKGASFQDGEYHLAMEEWIISSNRQILIQRRAESCEELGGFWGLTTGRMLAGEDTRSGAVREIQEELGLSVEADALQHLLRVARPNHLVWDVYAIKMDVSLNNLSLQREEVSKVRWVDEATFRQMLRSGEIFAYPEIEQMLQQALSLTEI